MTEIKRANPELFCTFLQWWKGFHTAGWDTRWRRRGRWPAQFVQKLGFHWKVTAPLFWGGQMTVVTGESSSMGLLTAGHVETAVTALMLHVIRPGQSVIDVGVHFGFVSLLAELLVGENGRVYGFEPNPEVRRLTEKNTRDHKPIQLFPYAVGESVQDVLLERTPLWKSAFGKVLSTSAQHKSWRVRMTTLDAILANRIEPISFFKCDAEGSENRVIAGAKDLLANDKPIVVLEADMPLPDGSLSQRAWSLSQQMASYSYRAYSMEFDGALHVAPLGQQDVTHANILFLPKGHPLENGMAS